MAESPTNQSPPRVPISATTIDSEADVEDLLIRYRLGNLVARINNRRDRINSWAADLPSRPSSLSLRSADTDDYLDEAGYTAFLQELAESDRIANGPPPASAKAVADLEDFVVGVGEEGVHCAVCRDGVGVGEVGKRLPCGHGYHRDCIVPWLGSRNSCPVCRFELETDDPDYEEHRRNGGCPASSR